MGGFPRITPLPAPSITIREADLRIPGRRQSGWVAGLGDGGARSLEEQAIGPIHNPVELAETHEHVVAKLGKVKGYQQQFRTVFGTGVN